MKNLIDSIYQYTASKTLMVGIILFHGFHFNEAQSLTEQKLLRILEKIETINKEINTVEYEANLKVLRPGEDDSVSIYKGKVWIKKLSTDSIFGYKLHVNGIDTYSDFDYYYDGLKSYEVRHSRKELTIIDPHNFPNDERNPSKARTSVSPVLHLLTDHNISKTLLMNNPVLSLDETSDSWGLKFDYPKDKVGQTVCRRIEVTKKDYRIASVELFSDWNGSINHTFHTITNYKENNPIEEQNLMLQSTYDDYQVKLKTAPQKRDPINVLFSSILNKPASDFAYNDFITGNTISLTSLKGKYVLLDFWETWCGYCILSIPKKQALVEKYQSHDFVMLGISVDNPILVKKLIEKNELKYYNLKGDNTILRNFKVEARPQYVLINKEGNIIVIELGNLDRITAELDKIF